MILNNASTLASVPRIYYKHDVNLFFEIEMDHVYLANLYKEYWHYTVHVSFAYYFIVKLIEWYMKPRKAFELKTALVLWNGALAVFSVVGLIRSSEEFQYTMSNHGLYPSLCYGYVDYEVSALWYMLFSLSKLWELGDTIFLVLRKRKLTFLHCYHHISVLVYTFHGGAEQLSAGRWFIVMNFTAHSLMYTYFTIMALGYKLSRKIAACVTLVQLAQMIIGVTISCSLVAIKTFSDLACEVSWTNLTLCFSIYFSYGYLFFRFFKATYLTPRKAHKKVE